MKRTLVITSPLEIFVTKIYPTVISGKLVAKDDALFDLDSSVLDLSLIRQSAMSKLLQIKAERLTEEYVSKYIMLPLEEAKFVAHNNLVAAKDALVTAIDKRNVGKLTSVDVLQSQSNLEAARTAYRDAIDAIDRQHVDITRHRETQIASEEHLAASMKFLTLQMGRRTIKAPWAGRISINVGENTFLDKGDIIATISD